MTDWPSKVNPKRYEYERQRDIAAGRPRLIPADATRRKVQALACYGWSLADIARDFGTTQQALQKSLRKDMIRRATAEKVDAWYLAHEMTLAPDTPYTRRTRAAASREGWRPPLAWEDIDAGILAEVESLAEVPRERFDLEVVEDFLQYGTWTRRTSRLEKIEIMRRWLADGRSEAELCRLTGWRPGRYGRGFQHELEEVRHVRPTTLDLRRGDLAS